MMALSIRDGEDDVVFESSMATDKLGDDEYVRYDIIEAVSVSKMFLAIRTLLSERPNRSLFTTSRQASTAFWREKKKRV